MSAIATARQLPALLQRRPLLAFFGLTYAISWSLWGLQPLLAAADPISARWLGIVAAYGPTLAAIALAGLLGPERQASASPRRRLWLAGAVLAGTVGLNVLIASNPLGSTHPLVAALLWLAITLLPAWVVWSRFSLRLGVRALLHTLTAWRVSPIWYGAALLLPLVISAAGIALMTLLGQPLPPFPRSEPLVSCCRCSSPPSWRRCSTAGRWAKRPAGAGLRCHGSRRGTARWWPACC
jgi:hypothetical protein